MATADPWIDALRVAHDDVATRARTFDADDLGRVSGAREWSVAQVLGHLGSQAEIAQAALDAALEHRDAPGLDANPAIWARWDALDDDGKASGYLEVSERFVASTEELDPATRESVRIDVGFVPEPIDLATAVGLRLNELTLHGWDVRVSTDTEAVLLSAPTELLIDRVGLLISFISHADAIDGDVALRVETTAPDRAIGLFIGDAVTLGEPPDDPDGVLQLPAESWLRLVAGRLTPDHTPPGVKLESDTVTLDDLRRVFPGY
jgi:uncharacterized protein (TIGR03083 family)